MGRKYADYENAITQQNNPPSRLLTTGQTDLEKDTVIVHTYVGPYGPNGAPLSYWTVSKDGRRVPRDFEIPSHVAGALYVASQNLMQSQPATYNLTHTYAYPQRTETDPKAADKEFNELIKQAAVDAYAKDYSRYRITVADSRYDGASGSVVEPQEDHNFREPSEVVRIDGRNYFVGVSLYSE